jgi:Arc/MetJ-type ribon-helix-helix transcriptional regulator
MKLSISLSEADVAILDAHILATGLPGRSAAVQRAIRMLADDRLQQDYAAAWEEWDQSDDRSSWESTTVDGLR